MATLTLHHWQNWREGEAEMRVASRQVIFLFDLVETYRFWAIDYWPTALSLPCEQEAPSPEDLAEVLNVVDVQPPHPDRLQRRIRRCVLGSSRGLSRRGRSAWDVVARATFS